MQRLGLGIIGCGWAAGELCRAAGTLGDVTVAAVFDKNEQAAIKLGTLHGATVHNALDRLLADPAVDVAYVGIPHNALAPVAEQALRAGKHVLVEKPMALDPQRALGLGKIADEQGMRLGVFFELRKTGPVQLARELIAGDAIGSIRAIRIRTVIDKPQSYWLSPTGELNWRSSKQQAGGGVVLMNAIHQLDIVRFVTGLEFARAMGEVATLSSPAEVEDTGSATMRMSNDAIASLTAAAHSPGARQQEMIEVDGEHGRIDIPYLYGAGGTLRLFLRRDWGEHAAGAWIDLPTQPGDMHAAMLDAFLTAVRTGGEPPATASDAAAALATVLAIYRSASEGRAVDL